MQAPTVEVLQRPLAVDGALAELRGLTGRVDSNLANVGRGQAGVDIGMHGPRPCIRGS